jgi:hypothetical protein
MVLSIGVKAEKMLQVIMMELLLMQLNGLQFLQFGRLIL